jgi:hypothetical protein
MNSTARGGGGIQQRVGWSGGEREGARARRGQRSGSGPAATRVTDKQGRAFAGHSDGGEHERVGWRGTDKWGQQHSAPDSVVKPNRFYFKQIQICANLCPIKKVPSCAPKIKNKMWLERG